MAEYFQFATQKELKELCRKARVVVTHGGVGTILDALQQGTPVVVVPRLKKYAEVIDDHQLDFARELEKQGKVIAVYDVEELKEALKKADLKPADLAKDRRLVDTLKRYIAGFEPG